MESLAEGNAAGGLFTALGERIPALLRYVVLSDGPARWANAKLVRYADSLVVLARYQTPRLRGWIEEKMENWLKLEINRDKTRVVDLKEEKASLDFLGCWHRDQYGQPAISACGAVEEGIAEGTGLDQRDDGSPSGLYTDPETDRQAELAIEGLGGQLFARLSMQAFRKINWHVGYRLPNHLKHHRSQRPYTLPEGMSYYDHFQRLGLEFLGIPTARAAD